MSDPVAARPASAEPVSPSEERSKDEPGLQREVRGVRGGAEGVRSDEREAQAGSAGRAPDGPPDLSEGSTSRRSWDSYFMEIAEVVASRATCDRKHVGAVIVRGRTILSTGYNGSIRGLPHCSEVGHMIEDGHCVRTIHAEINAIIQAAKNGVCIDGGTIYTTASPCWPCFKAIANAGIHSIVYREFYRDERIFEVAQALGMEMRRVPPEGEQGRGRGPGP